MLQELNKIPYIAALSESAVQQIARVARVTSHAPGEIIMSEADEDTPVFFINEGNVRVFRTNNAGREQTLLYLRQGDAFNLPTAFLQPGLAPASVAAVGRVQLVRISRVDFHQLVLQIPELALAVITDLSGKVEHLTGLVNDLSLKNVRARLAKFLLAQQVEKQRARWTQAEIAAQLGTSREIVSRMLKAFTSEGFIAIERHKITVTDKNKLRTET